MLYEGSESDVAASEELFSNTQLYQKGNSGIKMLIIPANYCSTINIYDKTYLLDGETY